MSKRNRKWDGQKPNIKKRNHEENRILNIFWESKLGAGEWWGTYWDEVIASRDMTTKQKLYRIKQLRILYPKRKDT